MELLSYSDSAEALLRNAITCLGLSFPFPASESAPISDRSWLIFPSSVGLISGADDPFGRYTVGFPSTSNCTASHFSFAASVTADTIVSAGICVGRFFTSSYSAPSSLWDFFRSFIEFCISSATPNTLSVTCSPIFAIFHASDCLAISSNSGSCCGFALSPFCSDFDSPVTVSEYASPILPNTADPASFTAHAVSLTAVPMFFATFPTEISCPIHGRTAFCTAFITVGITHGFSPSHCMG